MILTGKEKIEIRNWQHGLKGEILLKLSIRDDEAGSRLNAFCQELADIVPEIVLKKAKEDVLLSGILIGSNISYHAVPLSSEFMPFLSAMSRDSHLAEPISSEITSVLSGITTPAMLKLYVSPHCPFCPRVVMQCLAIAQMNRIVNVSVIDGSLFPDLAARDNVRSVPTLILDDSFRWTGAVAPEELINVIAHRDPVRLGPETLINIIHNGRAEELAQMMAAEGKVFPAFIDLLIDNTWSVRLGAMAAYEYLIEKSPALCRKINIELCSRFPDQEDRIKGDIIYLLGESADPSIVPFLKSIQNGDFTDEVFEASVDALNNFL